MVHNVFYINHTMYNIVSKALTGHDDDTVLLVLKSSQYFLKASKITQPRIKATSNYKSRPHVQVLAIVRGNLVHIHSV